MMKTRIGYLCELTLDMQLGVVLHETGKHFLFITGGS